jgi:zinc protease
MRKPLKNVLLCLAVILVLKSQAGWAGPAAADSMPTVDQVLDKYVQALGGKATIEKMTTVVITGKVDVPSTGETGSMETYRKAPNKEMQMINVPSNGPSQRGFDGTAGWNWDPDSGPSDMNPADLAAMKLESDFYRDIRLKELYPKISLKNKEKVGDREAYVVEAPHEDGSSEKMYFDTESGLLIQSEVPIDVPDEGKTVVNSKYEDYREVEGLKVPFTIRQSSADFDYVIKVSEVKYNVPVDDAKFKKPTQ